MAQFLTTHGVASEIEQVIMGAQGRLVLVTPFLKLSAILLERLQDAGRRRVLVSIVYGKAELSGRELAKLGLIPRLDLRFCENLHAKCYCNDVAMVVTSMNLHEFSEKNNREVGVLLTADEQPYRDGLREVESILANSSVVSTVPAQAARSPRVVLPVAVCRPETSLSAASAHPLPGRTRTLSAKSTASDASRSGAVETWICCGRTPAMRRLAFVVVVAVRTSRTMTHGFQKIRN